MTSTIRRNAYMKQIMSNLHVAVWANVVVSMYQESNIDSGSGCTRG